MRSQRTSEEAATVDWFSATKLPYARHTHTHPRRLVKCWLIICFICCNVSLSQRRVTPKHQIVFGWEVQAIIISSAIQGFAPANQSWLMDSNADWLPPPPTLRSPSSLHVACSVGPSAPGSKWHIQRPSRLWSQQVTCISPCEAACGRMWGVRGWRLKEDRNHLWACVFN